MIAVLADDLTGAAELGAVGLRHGLSAEIHTEVGQPCGADLISLDADSRAGSAAEAVTRMRGAMNHLLGQRPGRIYRKVDSVLRGHVLVELEVMMATSGCRRAILVPANPSLGRVIRGGQYFVWECPLEQTDFRNDPQYPRRSSDVVELLGHSATWPVRVCRPDQNLPESGIIVGEVESARDLRAWAEALDESTCAAGGAEFFSAVLQAQGCQAGAAPRAEQPAEGWPELYVCGSPSSSTRAFVAEAESRGIAVEPLPPNLLSSESLLRGAELSRGWEERALLALDQTGRVVVTIAQPIVREPLVAQQLGECLIDLTEGLLRQRLVGRVLVEGGATARALVRRMGWNRLRVLRELALGVVAMRADAAGAPVLIMKPGSYVWPEEIRRFPA